MTTKAIRQSVTFRATPRAVYEALMDAKKHAKFTGNTARISRKVGGKFAVYGGELHGTNLDLERDKKIVQAWRCDMDGWPSETTPAPQGAVGSDRGSTGVALLGWPKDHFSKATFVFLKTKGGTKLSFMQTGVPASCAKGISQGWHDYYWNPIKEMLDS